VKLLIVCQYYFPEQFLINEIAPDLVKQGHEVTVLTGLPNYPSGTVPDEYKKGKKRDEIIDGVRVIRCNEIGRKKGKIGLVLNYLSFCFFGCIKAKKLKEEFDLVFSYQLSPVFMALPAIAYKKKHRKPLFLYCLDIWPESAQAHVHNDKGFLYKLISKYSKKIYSQCDKIAVTSQPFIEYLSKVNGIDESKMVYIPQHADDSMLNFNLEAEDNEIADFMFAGNFGKGQRLDIIIKAAALLKDKNNFKIHLVGDGSTKDTIKELVKAENLEDKVIFHGQINRKDMPQYYKMADALLITLRGNNFVGNTMPGKLQTYMTAGKPIFASINGAAKEVIEESGCGACVGAEDSEGLASIMLDYIENKEKYSQCGKKAQSYFKENFTREIYIQRLQKQLENLLKEL